MNIVRLDEHLAIRQDLFKTIKIIENTELVYSFSLNFGYSVVVTYGDNKTYTLLTSTSLDACKFTYFKYLYLFSIEKEVGVLEFDAEDKDWFRYLIKDFRARESRLAKVFTSTTGKGYASAINGLRDVFRDRIKKYVLNKYQ